MLSYFLLPNADVSQLWYLSFLMLYELSLNFHDICFVGLCVEVASKSNHFNSRLKKEDLKEIHLPLILLKQENGIIFSKRKN